MTLNVHTPHMAHARAVLAPAQHVASQKEHHKPHSEYKPEEWPSSTSAHSLQSATSTKAHNSREGWALDELSHAASVVVVVLLLVVVDAPARDVQ